MNKSMLLYYNNLPKKWAENTKDNFKISESKFKELSDKLLNLPKKSATIYLQNGCKLFVPLLCESYSMAGIDFVDYFDSVFKQDKKFEISFEKQVYVIYNIGFEKALNTDFASRMLLSLLEKLKNENKHIFLCSHLSYTDFFKRYQIEVVNKISVKENEEEKFI